jgi:GH43 family beta-xylosidase
MMKKLNFTYFVLLAANIYTFLFCLNLRAWSQEKIDEFNIPVSNVHLSDPFIYADKNDSTYYMYGSGGNGKVYSRASKDLRNWTKPFVVYNFPATHWGGDKTSCWAAEVHQYKGKYYLFTTSDDGKAAGVDVRGDTFPHRATQIYVANSPRGPFKDFTNNKPHTPFEWPCLDGTLWIEDGKPYMVFCHEWTQITDGTMDMVLLPQDLGVPQKASSVLFKASEAPFLKEVQPIPNKPYVTDGPFLFKTKTGKLGMLWSSWNDDKYVLMASYSKSGKLKGPWIHDKELLFSENGGHGMLFHTFDGKLMLSLHYVNPSEPNAGRKPFFIEMDDTGDKLIIKKDGILIK